MFLTFGCPFGIKKRTKNILLDGLKGKMTGLQSKMTQ